MPPKLRGKWALGITPRNFTWVIKDCLAICERPGGYGDNHRRDDYNDYANYGAGKDDTPLDDGWRKRIRRMGNDV
mgnify:CR=1 FL=1